MFKRQRTENKQVPQTSSNDISDLIPHISSYGVGNELRPVSHSMYNIMSFSDDPTVQVRGKRVCPLNPLIPPTMISGVLKCLPSKLANEDDILLMLQIFEKQPTVQMELDLAQAQTIDSKEGKMQLTAEDLYVVVHADEDVWIVRRQDDEDDPLELYFTDKEIVQTLGQLLESQVLNGIDFVEGDFEKIVAFYRPNQERVMELQDRNVQVLSSKDFLDWSIALGIVDDIVLQQAKKFIQDIDNDKVDEWQGEESETVFNYYADQTPHLPELQRLFWDALPHDEHED